MPGLSSAPPAAALPRAAAQPRSASQGPTSLCRSNSAARCSNMAAPPPHAAIGRPRSPPSLPRSGLAAARFPPAGSSRGGRRHGPAPRGSSERIGPAWCRSATGPPRSGPRRGAGMWSLFPCGCECRGSRGLWVVCWSWRQCSSVVYLCCS